MEISGRKKNLLCNPILHLLKVLIKKIDFNLIKDNQFKIKKIVGSSFNRNNKKIYLKKEFLMKKSLNKIMTYLKLKNIIKIYNHMFNNINKTPINCKLNAIFFKGLLLNLLISLKVKQIIHDFLISQINF